MTNTAPSFGQESLDVNVPAERDLNARKSVGGAISIEFWDIDLVDLAGLEPADLKMVEPSNLREVLRPVETSSVFRLRTPLNPREFTTILRSPEDFEKSIVARIMDANALDPNQERKREKVNRGAKQALTAKREDLQDLLTGHEFEREQLIRLRKAAKARGYAHMTEKSMRQLMSFAWEVSYKNMVSVVAAKMNWSSAQLEDANRALTARLLTGPQSEKIKYWESMTRLAITYNQDRKAITKSRIKKVDKLLAKEQHTL